MKALHVKYSFEKNYSQHLRFGGIDLPIIKSAIKRNRQNKKRRELNRHFRGAARTKIKKARQAIERGDAEAAHEATREAISALDKAASKVVIHKNNAARRKSRLMGQLAILEK
jgi:small subunit ribosomal protein S20